MALINNIYVLVEKEDVADEAETVTHPTESGFPISDSVKPKPTALSISGKIADTSTLTASQVIAKLKQLQKSGSLIKYVGQCGMINSLQIQSFNASYGYKNYGGADFTMSLQKVKTVKSAYVAPTKKEEVKIESKPETVKVGDIVRFLGGGVYEASTDLEPKTTKGQGSSCVVTKIAAGMNAPYHLKSRDCLYGSPIYVYGWVREEDVTTCSTIAEYLKNGGRQQVQGADPNPIKHTVKSGERAYGILKTYSSKDLSLSKVVKDNPHAFTDGDPNKLIAGAVLKLYW